jgi:hypothetical protein
MVMRAGTRALVSWASYLGILGEGDVEASCTALSSRSWVVTLCHIAVAMTQPASSHMPAASCLQFGHPATLCCGRSGWTCGDNCFCTFLLNL